MNKIISFILIILIIPFVTASLTDNLLMCFGESCYKDGKEANVTITHTYNLEMLVWKKATYDMIDVCYDYSKYLSCTDEDIKHLENKFYLYYNINWETGKTTTVWTNNSVLLLRNVFIYNNYQEEFFNGIIDAFVSFTGFDESCYERGEMTTECITYLYNEGDGRYPFINNNTK